MTTPLTPDEHDQLADLIKRAARTLTPAAGNRLLQLRERELNEQQRAAADHGRTVSRLQSAARDLRQATERTEAALVTLAKWPSFVHPRHAIEEAVKALKGQ